MASPSVSGTPREAAEILAVTEHVLYYTATEGELVVVWFATAVTVTITNLVGFTKLYPATGGGTLFVLYKYLGPGDTGIFAIFTSLATKSASIAYNISGAANPVLHPPEVATVAAGTNNAPDSPSLSPSGGSADYLWLACFKQAGEEADDDTWQNNTPTGTGGGSYSPALGYQKTTGVLGLPATNCQICAASRAYTGASEDPSAWSTDQSLAWRALTVAVYPGGVPVVVTADAAILELVGPQQTVTKAPKVVTAAAAILELVGPTCVVTKGAKTITASAAILELIGPAQTITLAPKTVECVPAFLELYSPAFLITRPLVISGERKKRYAEVRAESRFEDIEVDERYVTVPAEHRYREVS